MAFFGGRLGAGLRAGPARCTNHCNKLIKHKCIPTIQDRRPIERRRFILKTRPFINAHKIAKTTSSRYITVTQHKIRHNARKSKSHYYQRAFYHAISRPDNPPPADFNAVQNAYINSDNPSDGELEVNSDHLLYIQSIHNPLHLLVSPKSDHEEICGTGPLLPLFEASMLSSPRRSTFTSASQKFTAQNTTAPKTFSQTSSQTFSRKTAQTFSQKPSQTSSQTSCPNEPGTSNNRLFLIADRSSPQIPFKITTPTNNSDPRQRKSNSTTTTTTTANQDEINDLVDRFSALHISTPTITENRIDHTIHAINEGKWPWAARSTAILYDVSPKRYEANLLMLMHDFVLKARHQYVLTKKWPAEEIERSALDLAAKARKIWAKGTREEICDEDEDHEGNRNYLEELDWFWRYWGYVVGGSTSNYRAGMTCVRAKQEEL